jgi:hypothetical protein
MSCDGRTVASHPLLRAAAHEKNQEQHGCRYSHRPQQNVPDCASFLLGLRTFLECFHLSSSLVLARDHRVANIHLSRSKGDAIGTGELDVIFLTVQFATRVYDAGAANFAAAIRFSDFAMRKEPRRK